MRKLFFVMALAMFCMSPTAVSARYEHYDPRLAAIAGHQLVGEWYVWCHRATGAIIIGTKYRPLSPPMNKDDSWAPPSDPALSFNVMVRNEYCKGLVRVHRTDFVETKPSQ